MSKVVSVVATVVVAAAVIVFAPEIAGALAAIGVTTSAAAITTIGIGMALSATLSGAMMAFQKVPSLSQSMTDRLNSSIQPTTPRKIVFGRTAAGNDIRFFEEHDLPSTKKDGYAQVIALASHRIEAVREFWIENDLSWAGSVQGPKAGGIVSFRPVTEGKPGTGFTLGSGNYWNASATFTGCAYVAIDYKLDDEIWDQGLPTKTTFIVDGCPLYDPRRDSTNGGTGSHRIGDQATWQFYDGATEIGRNPACALATYLIGYRINGKLVWGMGIPANRIDWDSFRDYANVCEELVLTQAGGTVQRYTCDGIVTTADSHESVIAALTAAMGSTKLTDVGGRYTLIGGYDDTMGPALDLTADHIVAAPGNPAPYSWVPVNSARETYNIASGRFADPTNLYQVSSWGTIETDPLADGVPRTLQVDLGMVSRPETCQRIAKQLLLKEARTPGHFAATFGPMMFAAKVGSLVTLSLQQEGWNRKLFRVIEQTETHDLMFQCVLREEDPFVYQWDREEKPLPASIRPPGYNPADTIVPADFHIETQTITTGANLQTSQITATWTPELSGRVQAIHIQSKLDTADGWTEQAAAGDPKAGSFTFVSDAPDAGLAVRARYRMTSGVYSPWVERSINSAPIVIIDQGARDEIDHLGGLIGDGGVPPSKLAPILAKEIEWTHWQAIQGLMTSDRITQRNKQLADDALLGEKVAREEAFLQLQADLDDAHAAIVAEQVARSTADEAQAQSYEGLHADLQDAKADLEAEKTARATAEEALANNIEQLEAGLGEANALILSEQTARADGDSANATAITGLRTRMGNAEANISQAFNAISDEQGARASAVTQVRTDLGGQISGVSQQISSVASTVDGVRNQWTIQADGNGTVAGVGLLNGTNMKSEFTVLADRIYLMNHAGSKVPPFYLSGDQVVMNMATMGSASIGTLHVAGQAITANQFTAFGDMAVNADGSTSVDSGWMTVGDGVDGNAVVSLSATVDSTVTNAYDGAFQVTLSLDTGGGFGNSVSQVIGVATDDGNSYWRVPVILQRVVRGAQVRARVTLSSAAYLQSSVARAGYLRNITLSVMGTKR